MSGWPNEIGVILDRVASFESVFPEAVELAARTGAEGLDKDLLVHRIAGDSPGQPDRREARMDVTPLPGIPVQIAGGRPS